MVTRACAVVALVVAGSSRRHHRSLHAGLAVLRRSSCWSRCHGGLDRLPARVVVTHVFAGGCTRDVPTLLILMCGGRSSVLPR